MTVPPYEPPPEPPQGWGPPPGQGYGPPQGWTQQGYGPPAPGQWGQPPHGQPYGQRDEEPLWAILAHLSIFVLGLIGPLVIYLVFKDSSPFTRQHAAEALNFHLTLLIASVVSAILVIVLVGVLMLLALFVWGAVLGVIAAVAAGNRRPYRYPLTIRFVS